ncbi:MAG: hypothetical protein COV75_03630 [Candidatus Omnitrophica bacterium CG11_big_fil_rev_8_21_14_0_20_63_9]|nr:MAG: hypothetical protein COV75_03630 [Candidatus Omnitrophica bacterium CG11_big_fil_rev_8_21_14_0_20_63_9]
MRSFGSPTILQVPGTSLREEPGACEGLVALPVYHVGYTAMNPLWFMGPQVTPGVPVRETNSEQLKVYLTGRRKDKV